MKTITIDNLIDFDHLGWWLYKVRLKPNHKVSESALKPVKAALLKGSIVVQGPNGEAECGQRGDYVVISPSGHPTLVYGKNFEEIFVRVLGREVLI